LQHFQSTAALLTALPTVKNAIDAGHHHSAVLAILPCHTRSCGQMPMSRSSAGDFYRETIIRPTLSSNRKATAIKRQPHPQHEACMWLNLRFIRFLANPAGPATFLLRKSQIYERAFSGQD
jgi:hypothetical protein